MPGPKNFVSLPGISQGLMAGHKPGPLKTRRTNNNVCGPVKDRKDAGIGPRNENGEKREGCGKSGQCSVTGWLPKVTNFVAVGDRNCYQRKQWGAFFCLPGLLFGAGNPKPVAPFPQGLAADTQAFCKFGFRHVALVIQDELNEVRFQGKVLIWLLLWLFG